MGLGGNIENKCIWGWTVLLSKKEKRREEKENFQNKSQSWELPEKVILLPGRANHGVMPVLSLGSTAARVGRDLPQPSSPHLLPCCSQEQDGHRFQPPHLHSPHSCIPSNSVLFGWCLLGAAFLRTGWVLPRRLPRRVKWAENCPQPWKRFPSAEPVHQQEKWRSSRSSCRKETWQWIKWHLLAGTKKQGALQKYTLLLHLCSSGSPSHHREPHKWNSVLDCFPLLYK